LAHAIYTGWFGGDAVGSRLGTRWFATISITATSRSFALIFWGFDARPCAIFLRAKFIRDQIAIAIVPAFGASTDLVADRFCLAHTAGCKDDQLLGT
jgi:hypothetical protein